MDLIVLKDAQRIADFQHGAVLDGHTGYHCTLVYSLVKVSKSGRIKSKCLPMLWWQGNQYVVFQCVDLEDPSALYLQEASCMLVTALGAATERHI